MPQGDLRFPPFHLTRDGELLRDGEVVRLRPKSLALLEHLARRAGELVAKKDLLAAVWPDVHVQDSVLKVCVRELRDALGDDATTPIFVENVPRRGYRFVAPVRLVSADASGAGIVGRQEELALLESALASAKQGERRLVFVSGEAGIGKSTLLDFFSARGGDTVAMARGQCIEQRGQAEPFLPFLEALTRLCRRDPSYLKDLREHAPSWLLQIRGALFDAKEREAIERTYVGTARGRMLTELVVGLEAVAASRPLCLLLEDLHWADPSTIDLLDGLLRGPAAARLLIVGTHRPVGSVAPDQFLADLIAGAGSQRCLKTLRLSGLTQGEMVDLVSDRFAGLEDAARVADIVHNHTGGNPLFAGNLLERLVAKESLLKRPSGWELGGSFEQLERRLPETLQEALAERLDGLTPEERHLLEAAAASGMDFSSAEVAAASTADAAEVARACHLIAARRGLLRYTGEGVWPDGTEFERFEFAHALIRDTLRSGIEPSRLRLLHSRIGRALELGHAVDTDEIAGELAVHFEPAGDATRAARYRLAAGRQALRRFAYAESTKHLLAGFDQLERGVAEDERNQLEIGLNATMGLALSNTIGLGAREVGKYYRRAFDLHGDVPGNRQLFPVLEGLHSYYVLVGDFPRAVELAQQMLELANARADPTMLLESHHTLGCIALRQGRLAQAVELLERALRLYQPELGEAGIHLCGHDSRVCCLGNLGVAHWMMGRSDEARTCALDALAHANAIGHPYSIAVAEEMLAWILIVRGENEQGRGHATRAVEIANADGFREIEVVSLLFQAWADARLGDAEAAAKRASQVWELVVSVSPSSAELGSLVSKIYDLAGWRERAFRLADDSLREAAPYGAHYLESDLLLTRARNGDEEQAMDDLRRARRVARRAGALAHEMQITQAEARLWSIRGERGKARRMLIECRDRFREGEDALPLSAVGGMLSALDTGT